MSFLDALGDMGGDLLGEVSGITVKVIDSKLAAKAAANATRPAESIQPVLAVANPANPVTGVNSNGETMVAKPFISADLMKNKAVVYVGGSILALIGLGIAYKLVK